MKHAISAALALALGIGLVTAAQAHGVMRQGALHNGNMQATRQAQPTQSNQQLNRQEITQAQQTLKSEGLYTGRIDGKVGANTRQALAKFQQKNGLPRTAKLDRKTLNALMGGQALGVGSSRPANNNGMNANMNSGTSAQPSMTPPASQIPGAGENAPQNNRNINR